MKKNVKLGESFMNITPPWGLSLRSSTHVFTKIKLNLFLATE